MKLHLSKQAKKKENPKWKKIPCWWRKRWSSWLIRLLETYWLVKHRSKQQKWDFVGVVRDGAQLGGTGFRPAPPGMPSLRRPNTVVLRTNRVGGASYKDVIDALVKVVRVNAVKTVQTMPNSRTRVTFRGNEARLGVGSLA